MTAPSPPSQSPLESKLDDDAKTLFGALAIRYADDLLLESYKVSRARRNMQVREWDVQTAADLLARQGRPAHLSATQRVLRFVLIIMAAFGGAFLEIGLGDVLEDGQLNRAFIVGVGLTVIAGWMSISRGGAGGEH